MLQSGSKSKYIHVYWKTVTTTKTLQNEHSAVHAKYNISISFSKCSGCFRSLGTPTDWTTILPPLCTDVRRDSYSIGRRENQRLEITAKYPVFGFGIPF